MAKHVKNIEAELIRQNTELKQEVHELKQTILLLEEQVAFLTKKIYGQSSERINSDQLSLFGQSGVFTEPEQTGNQSEETYQVITKIRSKKKTRKQTISPDLPVQDVLIPFDASQCPHGHSDWLIVGKKFVRQEVC
ncbi:transposase, partial [Secundilactobacillus paracollinoides]